MNEFPIAICLDHDSLPRIAPLLFSIKKYVKNPRVFIVTDSEEVEVQGCEVIYKANTFKNTYPRITGHTYYRLFLDELLPADVTKCLYLDFDTILVSDISDILDGDDWVLKAACEGLVRSFNAGVLAFNFTDRCKELMAECRAMIGKEHYDDQSILNVVFHSEFTAIPYDYNVNGMISEIKPTDKIIHYIGGTKAWNFGTTAGYWFDLVREMQGATSDEDE